MTWNASCDELEEAGEKAVLILYNSTIDSTRERMLSQKVLKAKSFIKPATLPPTKSAMKYHSLRCYYQIMKQLSNEKNLDAEKWGWITIENKYVPKTTDQLAAPEALLKVVHCNCSLDCSTLRCTCRKNGLECSSLCGTCQTKECANSSIWAGDGSFADDIDHSENDDEL